MRSSFGVTTASSLIAIAAASLVAVSACSSDEAPVVVDPPCALTAPGPSSRFFVLSRLVPSVPDSMGDPNVLTGVDVDHHVTADTGGDPIGCGFVDYRSPAPGDATGVDAQLGQLLQATAGSCDVAGLLAQNIHDGRVVLLVELSQVDDYVCDHEVSVDVYLGRLPTGVAAPILDASGLIAPGQTFDLDPGSLSPDGRALAHSDARIAEGIVIAPGLSLNIPIYDLTHGAAIAGLRDAELRLPLSVSAGIDNAVLGAGISVSDVISLVDVLCPGPTDILRVVLDGQADLAPDATGVCRSISIGFEVSGVAAVRGVTASP